MGANQQVLASIGGVNAVAAARAAIMALSPSLWLDATRGTFQTVSGAAATANGDPVGQIIDQVTGTAYYSQATAGKRPTLSISGGVTSINFASASSQYWTASSPLSLTDHTVFMVLSSTNNGTNMVVCGKDAPEQFLALLHRWDAVSANEQYYTGVGGVPAADSDVPTATWGVLESDRVSNKWSPFWNGQSQNASSKTTDTTTMVLSSVGAYNGGSLPFNGKLQHLIAFAS